MCTKEKWDNSHKRLTQTFEGPAVHENIVENARLLFNTRICRFHHLSVFSTDWKKSDKTSSESLDLSTIWLEVKVKRITHLAGIVLNKITCYLFFSTRKGL